MGSLFYGTSSWSDKSWVGPFYPEGTAPRDYLAHYAEQFGAVEADVTYYRVPSDSMVEGWARRTPDGFRMAAKFPRSIVHAGEGPRPSTASMVISITLTCSSCVSVAASPVQPQGHITSVPLSSWNSTSSDTLCSSTAPFLNGVASATIEPSSIVGSSSF